MLKLNCIFISVTYQYIYSFLYLSIKLSIHVIKPKLQICLLFKSIQILPKAFKTISDCYSIIRSVKEGGKFYHMGGGVAQGDKGGNI